jgi:hypothetical protein
MESEMRAGRVMLSCLARIENAVAAGALSKWTEMIEWEDQQEAGAEFNELQAQLKMAHGTKAGKLMRDCLNTICNSMYQFGWDRWISAVGDDLTAGRRMQYVLNSIVEGLTWEAWQRWTQFNLFKAGEEKVDVLRSGRTAEELKYRLELELSRRAGRKMRQCLNVIIDVMCKSAMKAWQVADARIATITHSLGRMCRCLSRLLFRHAMMKWREMLHSTVNACVEMQRFLNRIIDTKVNTAWYLWREAVLMHAASGQGLRQDREKEELLYRLETELSRRAGRKMRQCLNVIIDVMCKSAFKAWLEADARLVIVKTGLDRTFRILSRLHLSRSIGLWQECLAYGDDEDPASSAMETVQHFMTTMCSNKTRAAFRIWRDCYMEVLAGGSVVRLERQNEELAFRLEMELSRRAGRKMRDCLAFIEKSYETQAFKIWVRTGLRSKHAGKTMQHTLNQIVASYTTAAWHKWRSFIDTEKFIIDQRVHELNNKAGKKPSLACLLVRTRTHLSALLPRTTENKQNKPTKH